ncbi:hypothetical protein BGAL_0117g00180 [Botrytis galanthina]|uniref:Uncharacterized protein n=1 Tax=Botrytis galanthina TaxID=278940 RepID=A0A4S8R0I2_9HELO|nr:hypothetical protein BGAL_0117g00180 [Botrytis galanthina]
MAKGPIVLHRKSRGEGHLIHYPPQDTLTAINDTQRQEYNKALICKGVSDDGDEELLRNDNYKRLFPWYEKQKNISSHLSRIRRVAQPTTASKLPPNLTPAQQQQVQAQKQVYDAHVAVSRIAASQVAPPSTQKATASASSQSDLIHRSSAQNDSTTRLQSGGNSSPGRVEPPLASDNLSTPGATANPSEQAGPATDSHYGQADYQAQTEYSNNSDSDSYRESSADITDDNQLLPTPSTPHIIVKTEPLSPT